jgi:hypothetical protein
LTFGLRAEEIIGEALEDFPAQTERLEYSNPGKLRTLPNYNLLAQLYLGAPLQYLKKLLAQVGVKESDINELVLGWQTADSDNPAGGSLYGLAAGRFRSDEIGKLAALQGWIQTPIGNNLAYCLPPAVGGTCLAVIGATRGAFGSRGQLSAMLTARNGGGGQRINSNSRFASLVNQNKSDAPIWGVAIGSSVADWLSTSIPGQDSKQLDGSQAFSGVDTLAYTINIRENVHLEAKLDCKSPAAAANVRQLLEVWRSFEQLTQQNQNPDLPNPFQNVAIGSTGSQVELKLDTAIPRVK